MSNDEKSGDSFASLFEAETRGQKTQKATKRLSLGELVRAEIVQVGKDAVFVEVASGAPGQKRQTAFLNLEDVKAPDGSLTLKAGDTVEAVVVEITRGGDIRLGRTMGKPQGLAELERAHAAGIPVEGKVVAVNKGGLEVEVAGARAFCPISQADKGYLADPSTLVGQSHLFVITELREGGKRIVLSRRAVLEREAKAAAELTLSKLTVGATVKGSVSAVRDFGAFVDLGGVEGLIPLSELSHDRGAKASDMLSPGDAVEVQVREIKDGPLDKRGNKTLKITLSLKALAADPWDAIDTLAPVGRVVRGSVVRVVDFGGFVRIAPGIEGLLHVSELGGKVSHPSAVLKVGEPIDVVVRQVDRATKKISLAPAPEGLSVGAQARAVSIAVGALVTGTVDHVEPYGVFLQVEGTRGRVGRGLIPNAELGVSRGADTRKLFPAGTKLTAKVLETGEGKLRLSLKAVKDDEERADFDGYKEKAGGERLGTFADLLKKK